ncbi:MAG TPA: hypothetical protein VLI04_01220 [Nocardioidaceae bacterium]|nr:hypothetical protein [Nocardioidaceae bacterium]
MTRRLMVTLTLLLALIPSAAAATPHQSAAQVAAGDSPVSVVLDETERPVGPGEKIRFESTVRNTSDQAVSGLVAHVAILTSDPDVYVDPEDWSPRRTQYIDELGPGEESSLTWNVQAVTTGPLILYVAVTDPGTDTVAASGPLYMTVGGQRVVNSAGVFPLALGVPAGVLLLLALTGVRRRSRK